MRNIGTVSAGVVGGAAGAGPRPMAGATARVTDEAIAGGGALLASELEKRDSLLREPLTSVTYARDLPIRSGGGWAEFVSALSIDYGMTGGSGSGAVHAPGANAVPVVQANLDKDIFRAHVFSVIMRIMFIDMQRSSMAGRNLDQMLTGGVRLAYDKHMDENAYLGLPAYGTVGLLNNPNVVATNVAIGASLATEWAKKTPDEILADVNRSIEDGWAASGYDRAAMPNHILMPYAQYNLIATAKVSPLAEKTILTFLLENNIAAKNGGGLEIGATAFCKGAGAGGTDRMATYVHGDRFVALEELAPLARTMTQPNIDALAYDSVYMANVSEVELFYTQPITYHDGI